MRGHCVNSSIQSSLCLANIVVSLLGLAIIGGGVLIVLDYQNAMEIREEVMDEGKEIIADYVKQSIEDFFTLFNKEGGWLNLGCVSIGIGAVTVAVSFFGFFGVHEKSAFLLFTYIILLSIGLILQVCSAVIIFNRSQEMRVVRDMLNTNSDKLTSDKYFEKMIFYFLLSGLFSTVSVILLLVFCILRRQADRDGFRYLQKM